MNEYLKNGLDDIETIIKCDKVEILEITHTLGNFDYPKRILEVLNIKESEHKELKIVC